jgi:hypothetical protein
LIVIAVWSGRSIAAQWSSLSNLTSDTLANRDAIALATDNGLSGSRVGHSSSTGTAIA